MHTCLAQQPIEERIDYYCHHYTARPRGGRDDDIHAV